MSKLKWGILGTGQIAQSLAENFSSEVAELYAVASRNNEKAKQFATKNSIPHSYGDYHQMLNDPSIDIIYIATPHSHHYQWIKAALLAGKHVLCEKVITINKEQLDEVIEIARSKDLYLTEAMTIYHMPLYSTISQWIKSNDVGLLKMIQVMFGSKKELDSDSYFFKKELAGGALFDIGTYALSFARMFLTEKPTEIKTIGSLHESGVDETSGIVLKNNQQELATISLTFRARMPKMGVVAFEKGYLTIMNYPRASTAVFTHEHGKEETIHAENHNHALNFEVDDFTNMITTQSENKFLQYTLDVVEIMDVVRKEWGLKYPFE